MKALISFLVFSFFSVQAFAQNNIHTADSSKAIQVVDAACGECQFGLTGKSCDLAVRINGQAYFVSGTSIDEHGDAHAKDGFCNAVRKASVQGEVKDGKFAATYFKLQDTVVKKKSKKA